MSTPFLSSEEYDERAHALYNEGQYDEALAVLREGLALYPGAAPLHVGEGYARMARDEFAWARRSFAEALHHDPEHEDALAGMGELLLKFGREEEAFAHFERLVALGYDDDAELMLQVGRALFREGYAEAALPYFEHAVAHDPESAEAVASVGYALHRLGKDPQALTAMRRALTLDPGFGEARVYLANLLYDAGELDAALAEFERTAPGDHWDEFGVLRLLELKRTLLRLPDGDPEMAPWEARLAELTAEPDAVDALLAEVEQAMMEREEAEAEAEAQAEADRESAAAEDAESPGSPTALPAQLEALGELLGGLAARTEDGEAAPLPDGVAALPVGHERRGAAAEASPEANAGAADSTHRVEFPDGTALEGTWEQIVQRLRDVRDAGRPLDAYMAAEARRWYGATGALVQAHAPEAFLRGGAHAGVLRIVR
jgi:Flp pilus assembly protein TadD